ncbi:MBOAT family O-acyltransferase [Thalassospira povalilytica]|uniref:Probable alginate O-acetylase AlgI n=1 Tax=Thalassospira povalilytica TaxID=732237 RepID=A0ABX4RCN9_9PROT|nr:MBOAT family O-acyltransferase [Thalassospira povalilytica]PKR52251.1 MBOAT family protein [Thalassospira povalilytica]
MLFQLPSFLIFFVAFCAFFAICPKRLRLVYVTLASLFFYAWWYPPYLILLVGMVVGCWLLLQLIWRDKGWLTVALILAFMPLVFFKYMDFLLESVAALTGLETPHFGWTVPLAVSFVTFSVVSYMVDTARQPGKTPPRFWSTAVYVTFFPHLIAGPILRAHHILPQLPQLRLDRAAFVSNLALFTTGMLKKVLVADPVGVFVDQAYAGHATLSGWEALVAIFGFSIQIYCDFSAYSDMAIALAGMLGINFPENFRSPYGSASLSEIWRRWHMTLSFWLRDYVFKPLHHRLHKYARQLSIILTMTLSGLWHGAAWTFVLWGLIQGLIISIESASGYSKYANKVRGWQRAFCIGLTFLVWSFLTVIFRAPNLSVAYDVAIGGFVHGDWITWPAAATMPVIWGAILLVLHPFDQIEKIRTAATRIPAQLLVPVLFMLIVGSSILASQQPQNFYYFDF